MSVRRPEESKECEKKSDGGMQVSCEWACFPLLTECSLGTSASMSMRNS